VNEDVVSIAVDLLDTNWNADNCVKPQIIAPIEQYKRVDLVEGDAILVYDTGPSMRAKGSIFYDHEDFDSSSTLLYRLIFGRLHQKPDSTLFGQNAIVSGC